MIAFNVPFSDIHIHLNTTNISDEHTTHTTSGEAEPRADSDGEDCVSVLGLSTFVDGFLVARRETTGGNLIP